MSVGDKSCYRKCIVLFAVLSIVCCIWPITLTVYESNLNTHIGKGKGKAVQLQAWSDPKGSRRLRFPDFMTTAEDSGKVVSLTHRLPLPPGNTPGTHFC